MLPPHLLKMFCKVTNLDPDIKVIRASMHRLELSYWVLLFDCQELMYLMENTVLLAMGLNDHMASDKQMMAFFPIISEMEMF